MSRYNGLPGYDAWATRSDFDSYPPQPECRDCGSAFLVDYPDDLICDECRVSECDICGEEKAGCINTTYRGMDAHACPKCCGAEEDEAADRGDWRFHQDHDQ